MPSQHGPKEATDIARPYAQCVLAFRAPDGKLLLSQGTMTFSIRQSECELPDVVDKAVIGDNHSRASYSRE
jgi:hypothetical protein